MTQFLTTKKCGLIGIDEFTLGNGSVNWNDNNKTVKVGIGVRIACFEGLMKRDGANLCRLIPAADNIMFDAERLVTIQNTGTGTSKVEVIEYPTPPTP